MAYPIRTVLSIHWEPGQNQSLVGSCTAPKRERVANSNLTQIVLA